LIQHEIRITANTAYRKTRQLYCVQKNTPFCLQYISNIPKQIQMKSITTEALTL